MLNKQPNAEAMVFNFQAIVKPFNRLFFYFIPKPIKLFFALP